MSVSIASLLAEIGVDTSKGERGLTQFDNKLRQTGKSGGQALAPVRQALEKVDGAARVASLGMAGLGAAMGVGAVVAVTGRLAGAVVEMGKMSEQSDRLAAAMDTLAIKAGTTSGEILTRLQQASGGAIAEYDLMLAANKSMMLGVADSAEEMGQLMEIARVRGTAMGLSTAQAFDNLVTGLGRGSALILDNLGIVVDAEATNAAYAESIGKTVAELTEQEKKQALVNATLKEATGAALPAASAYERMGAAMADMKVELGDLFGPAIAATAGMIADSIRSLQEYAATPAPTVLDGVLKEYEELKRLRDDLQMQGDFEASQATAQEAATRRAADAQHDYALEALLAMNATNEAQQAATGMHSVQMEELAALTEAQKIYNDARMQGLNDSQARAQVVQAEMDKISQQIAQGLFRTGERNAVDPGAAAAEAQMQAQMDKWVADQAAFEARITEGYARIAEASAVGVAGVQQYYTAQQEIRAAMDEVNMTGAQQEAVLNRMATQYGVLTSASMTSAGSLYTADEAIKMVTEDALASVTSFQLMSTGAIAAGAAVSAAMIEMANQVGNAFATMFAQVSAMGSAIMQSSNINPAPGKAARAGRDENTLLPIRPFQGSGAGTNDQFEGMSLMRAHADTKAAEAAQKLADKAQAAAGKLSDAAQKAGDLSGKLQGLLDKVPGLMGTSEVTDEQMENAKLGIPQNFADDYLRRLTDEVMNGVDWADVDMADAAKRAGIDPSLPVQAQLKLFTEAWKDSSLFADPANMDLFNMDAVQSSLQKQAAAETGKANIMALFGIGEDATVAAVASLGLSIQQGIPQFLADNGMGDAGAKLAEAISAGVGESGIPVGSGLDSWLSSGSGAAAVSAFGKDLGGAISPHVRIKPILEMPNIPTTPSPGGSTPGGSTPTPSNTEAPPVRIPTPNSGPTPQSRGGTTVVFNNTLTQPYDVPMLARAVLTELKRHA